MRYTSIILLALAASTLPALAQNRTLPAVSYQALQAPIDYQQPPTVAVDARQALPEGRSVYRQRADHKRHHQIQR